MSYRPTRIILHCSATKDSGTVSWQAIRRFHMANGWNGVGYHAGIELINDQYEVMIGRLWDRPGAHTSGENHDSLGVCFVGDFEADPPPLAQWQVGVQFIRSLCWVFGIGHDRVFGHREFTDRKTCPGTRFDLDLFRQQLHPY